MTWPPAAIAANKAPGAPTSSTEHPDHHNELATAVNDIVTRIQDVPGAGATYLVASSGAPQVIKDRADYICDGTADQVQINTALLLGSVQLTDGDYNITAPIAVRKPGTGLRGTGIAVPMTNGDDQGRGFGTRIIVNASFSGSAAVLVDQNNTYVVGGADLSGFTVDGDAYTSTAVDGVRFRGFFGHINRVFCQNMSGHGFHLLGNESPDPAWSTYDTQLSNLMATQCSLAGLYCGENAADLIVSDCVFQQNTGPGVQYASGSSGQFTNVHTYTNDYGYLFSGGGSRTKLSNCKIEHSQKDGILFDTNTGVTGTDSVQIVNCGFNCNGESTNNTYDHIGFHTQSNTAGSVAHTNVQIVGCNFGNSDNEVNLARNCINLWTQGTKAVIADNNFRDTLALAGVATGRVSWTSTTVKETIMMTGNAGQADMRGSAVPTVSMQAGAGTSPPAAVVTAGSTTTKGRLTWGTGTSPTTGVQFRVTYANAYISSGQQAMVMATNAATAALDPYVSTNNLDYFEVTCRVAPTASQGNTTYGIAYVVGE